MDIAEKIGINFSNTVCLGVKINDIKSLNKNLKRGFSPDESGVWYKNEVCHNFSDCKNNDDLVLWLQKTGYGQCSQITSDKYSRSSVYKMVG